MAMFRTCLALTLLLSASALSRPANGELRPDRIIYTKPQLEAMTKERLINIILDLQAGGDDSTECTGYNVYSMESGRILRRVNTPGYSGHGSLLWPDGKKLLDRKPGYQGDGTLYYPNGQVMARCSPGYQGHGSLYWPNGKTLYACTPGYQGHKSIYRSDGTYWFTSGTPPTSGLPMEQYVDSQFTVIARESAGSTLSVNVKLVGTGYTVRVVLNNETWLNQVRFFECF
jgi:DNA-binding beta-propeller fold protein YncE